MWIFIWASSRLRLSTPLPQPVMVERQQESGTSVLAEKVALVQSRYSWVPQQSSYNK